MAWTPPKTDFDPGDVLTFDEMNAIGDNLVDLRDRDGMVLIDETVFSAVSSIPVDGVFSADFENYFVVCRMQTSNGGGTVNCQFRVGGATTATNYNFVRLDVGAAVNGSTATGQTTVRIGANDASGYHSFEAWVISPFVAEPSHWNSTFLRNNCAAGTETAQLAQTGNTSFDGFILTITTGTATGKLRVYGLNQ